VVKIPVNAPCNSVLWEGAGLLVLNKPAGLAVHGFPHSLDNQVQAYLKGKLPPSLSYRPGPLHRLDKPTSGIIVFGVSLEAARWFSALLAEGKIRKRYLAIVEGTIKDDQVWEETLFRDKATRKTYVQTENGRRALTRMSPLAWSERGAHTYTYAQLEIETGRTHQIRAQAASHGHPLAGDRKYGGAPMTHSCSLPMGGLSGQPGGGKSSTGFFLHAAELEFPEEAAEKSGIKDFPLVIKAPLPEVFSQAVKEFFQVRSNI
jgi:23S rRNA pseudouridine955/2504/2580 synthase